MSVSVCVSVCVSYGVSVCSGYNFWIASHKTSRSSLSIKVTGSTSRSYEKNIYLLPNSMSNFTCFNTLILCVWLQAINKVKFIHQSEGHIKVKVKYLHPFRFYVASTLFKRVVWIRLNALNPIVKSDWFQKTRNVRKMRHISNRI